MMGMDMGDERLQLIFGPVGGKIGDLRFERADEIGRGVDNGLAELENGIRFALKVRGKFAGVGVEADTEQGVVLLPGAGEAVDECHDNSL